MVFGEDALPFEAKLELDEEGRSVGSAPILRAKTPVPLLRVWDSATLA